MRVGLMDRKFGDHFSSADAFNAVLFGGSVHPNVANYIRNQQVDYSMFDQASKGLGATLRTHVDGFMNEDHLKFIRKATITDKNAQVVSQDHRVFLPDLVSLQQAGRVMIHAIMANPEVHDLYHQGLIEGYPGLYSSDTTETPGLGHMEYMRTTNAMLHNGKLVEYFWRGETPPLLFEEKSAVLNTWRTVLKLIEEGGQDPTSPDGTLLSAD